MASIWQLPSGSWRWQVHTGRRLTGGKWAKVSGTAPSKRMAEIAAAKAESKRAVRVLGDPTVADWVTDHLDRRAEVLAPSTMHTYRQYTERFILPAIGDRRLSQVTARDVERMLDRIDGAKSTRSQVRAILSGALKEAKRDGLVDTNAASDARAPQAARNREVRHMAPPDVAGAHRALDAARVEGPTAELLVTLALNLGARRGELVALRWTDIVWFGSPSITIARSISTVPGVWVEKDTKTHSVRVVPLTKSLRRRLWQQYARLHRIGRPWGVVPVWVVADDPTVPWLPDRATQTWGRIRRTAGLDGVRLHDARHFVATQLMASGLSPVDVAELLGHADPSMTMRVYTAPTLEGQRRAANRMEDLLRS